MMIMMTRLPISVCTEQPAN